MIEQIQEELMAKKNEKKVYVPPMLYVEHIEMGECISSSSASVAPPVNSDGNIDPIQTGWGGDQDNQTPVDTWL